MSRPQIFKMNDCDWVAASSPEEAVTCLAALMGEDPGPAFIALYDIEPVALTEAELDAHTISEEDPSDESTADAERRSFRQELDRMIASGEKFPSHFATTEC